MSLRIEQLTFRNFRNYGELHLAGLGDITVLVGENAIGKTNIVEGVQLLTALTSFRHATAEQLIRHDCESARLGIEVTDGNRELSLDLTLDGKARKYRLNGKAKRPADLKGLVPSVMFTPDDLELVKGSMTGRRTALDTLGSQVNRNYYVVRRDYEKVIRHKNRLLKEEVTEEEQQELDALQQSIIGQYAPTAPEGSQEDGQGAEGGEGGTGEGAGGEGGDPQGSGQSPEGGSPEGNGQEPEGGSQGEGSEGGQGEGGALPATQGESVPNPDIPVNPNLPTNPNMEE